MKLEKSEPLVTVPFSSAAHAAATDSSQGVVNGSQNGIGLRGLTTVRAGCPHLDALAGHIRDFAEMMTLRQGETALEG